MDREVGSLRLSPNEAFAWDMERGENKAEGPIRCLQRLCSDVPTLRIVV